MVLFRLFPVKPRSVQTIDKRELRTAETPLRQRAESRRRREAWPGWSVSSGGPDGLAASGIKPEAPRRRLGTPVPSLGSPRQARTGPLKAASGPSKFARRPPSPPPGAASSGRSVRDSPPRLEPAVSRGTLGTERRKPARTPQDHSGTMQAWSGRARLDGRPPSSPWGLARPPGLSASRAAPVQACRGTPQDGSARARAAALRGKLRDGPPRLLDAGVSSGRGMGLS